MTATAQTMSRDEVTEKVKAIVIEALHAQKMANEITDETFLGTLGLDSLNIVDILLGLETEFGVAFDEEELDFEALETLGSLVGFVVDAQKAG